MKRKLMACLLFVCMVIGVFAVLPVQASEAKEAKSDTDYSALYVQDGLTLFFEAYTGETLDLDAGKWYASNDSTKFITLANANGNLQWTHDAKNGGVGYRMTFNQWSSLAQVGGGKNPNVGLVLDFSYLPEDEYTVETVLLWQGLTNDDGTIYKMADPSIEKWGIHTRNFSPVALGPLQALGFVSDADSVACPQAMTNSLRWFYSNATWAATKENTSKMAFDRHQVANNAVSAISVTMANDQYGFYSGGTLLTTFDPLTKGAALAAQGILPHAGEFHFLYGYAGTAYTVRVYDRALTEAEMQQNHFADLAASVNLDISAYLAASEDSRAFVNRIFAGFAVGTSKEALEESLEQLLGASGGGSLEDSLYVTDGMTLFLSAMSDYASSVSVNDGIGYWRAQTGQFITLTGNTWFQKPDGGVGYSLNRSEYGSGKAVGLILDSDMLPSEDYSVEIVMSVQGVTDNEGNRFVDTTSNYGLYHNYGMAFGPMKSITFVSLRQEGKADGILEGRYYYIAQGDWKAAKNICKYYDYAFRTEDMDDVITWNVYHDCYPSGRSFASKYEFVSDNLDTPKNVIIGSGDYVPYEQSEQYFNIMNRFPATFYAVRVYDRVLTAAERNQNHVADLINFYELDTTFLDITVNVLGDADKVYATLTDIDFSLSKEEAQEAFDGALGKAWISSVGVSIRTDNNVGLRATFRLPKTTVDSLISLGYTIEAGIGFSLDSVSTVEECQTVVKVITREGGRQESFFLSEDEFAMSVQYRNCGTAEYLTQVTFIGYMAIYDAEGNLFYYLPSVMDPSSFDLSPFNAYRYHAYGDYSTNSFIKKMVDGCYTKQEFNVSVNGNDATADGSAEKPFATVLAAYEKLCELLTQTAVPVDATLRLGAGVHRVNEVLEFNGVEMDKSLVRVNIVGEDAETTTLTSTYEIDSTKFAQVPGKPYYVYHFEGDAPFFRFLYVNGKIADLAYNGVLRAVNEDQYITKYWRAYNNGITIEQWNEAVADNKTGNLRSTAPIEPKMYMDADLLRGVTEDDLGSLEVHLEAQWKFNVMQVTRIDWSDTVDNGELVAVYFESSQYFRMQGPANEVYSNRPYWFENCLSFVDTPGEYFYDTDTGDLYYYPEEGTDITDYVFEVPTTEHMIVTNNVDFFAVDNLTFTGLDHTLASRDGYLAGQAGGESKYGYLKYAAITVDDAEHFTVENCIFRDMPGDSINMRGRLRDIAINSNRFFDIGATGIRVGVYGITSWSEENSIIGLEINNNYMDGMAWNLRESNALLVSQAVNVQIYFNTIQNCSYSAMSIGVQAGAATFSHTDNVYNLKNVDIAYNYITNFMTDMRDGGAIYTLGGNAEVGYTEPLNFIHDNYIVWSKITGDAQGKSHTTGIYNDNSSSNWLDYNNVQVLNPDRYWKGMYFHYVQSDAVHDVYIEDNTYIYCSSEEKDDMFDIIYRNINGDKNVFEEDTLYFTNPEDAYDYVSYIVDTAGSDFCKPNYDDIMTPDF